MRIGITYDLKAEGLAGAGLPDDAQEEFDSPATIEAIAAALRGLGHEVCKLGDGPDLLARLLVEPPQFVFNLAEGQGVGRCREARVPAVLELLGIPYTGSDPLTLAVTLDKDCAKRLVASEGVAVPRGVVVEPPAGAGNCNLQFDKLQVASCKLQFPVIVKPAWEGSSKGIRDQSLVDQATDLEEAVAALWAAHRQPVLIEEYIPGAEVTVGVLGNAPPRILGIMGIVPRQPTERFVYSLEVKRDYLRQVRYECPAALAVEQTRAVEEAALKIYRVLGCRDVARVDLRLRGSVPYFLEVNPLPGLNPESSDLVLLAKLRGWTHSRLIEAILQAALDRHRRQPEREPYPAICDL